MAKRVAALVLAVAGCLTRGPGGTAPAFKPSPPSKPIAEFPSATALAEIEKKPVGELSMSSAEVPSEGWTVESGETAAIIGQEPWTPKGPWEEAVASAYAASGRKATATRPLACVAKEVGRFWLAHKGSPPEALQRFIGAVCGVFSPAIGFGQLAGTTPPGTSDERVLAHWGPQFRPDLIDHLPADARRVGFWAGRQGNRSIVVASYELTSVDLKPFSLAPDANGDVTIEGRLNADVSGFFGLVNQGRFGFARCVTDPAVVKPDFRVKCPVLAGDESAWIQIAYTPPRRVLATAIVQVLARRDPSKPPVFSEPSYATSAPVNGAAEFAPAVLAALNATRALAGLRPVALSKAQSEVAARVSRQYFARAFAAEGGDNAGDRNTIALGLLAGWQVTGTIRNGTFYSALVTHTRDAGRWLDAALSIPLGRKALLAPDIDEIAFGPTLFDKPRGIASVACGYRLHHGNDHRADVAALYDRIAEARRRAGLPAVAQMGGVKEVIARQLDRVQQSGLAPYDALRLSLEEVRSRAGWSLTGYVVETVDLDATELPPALLQTLALKLEIGVTHYKPPGAAWAQLVIVYVYAGAPTLET